MSTRVLILLTAAIGIPAGAGAQSLDTAAVAKAVADSVAEGVIPKNKCEDFVIVCGVFIHWEAADDKKIYDYNYEATKLSIARAMKGEPTAEEMVKKKDSAKHPFSPK